MITLKLHTEKPILQSELMGLYRDAVGGLTEMRMEYYSYLLAVLQ